MTAPKLDPLFLHYLRCPNKAKGWFTRSGKQWISNPRINIDCADAVNKKGRVKN